MLYVLFPVTHWAKNISKKGLHYWKEANTSVIYMDAVLSMLLSRKYVCSVPAKGKKSMFQLIVALKNMKESAQILG